MLLHFETAVRQSRLVSKIKTIFHTLWPHKIRVGLRELSESIFACSAHDNVIHSRPSVRLEHGCQKIKGQRQNIKACPHTSCMACYRLCQLLVGFRTHFKSVHFHVISSKPSRYQSRIVVDFAVFTSDCMVSAKHVANDRSLIIVIISLGCLLQNKCRKILTYNLTVKHRKSLQMSLNSSEMPFRLGLQGPKPPFPWWSLHSLNGKVFNTPRTANWICRHRLVAKGIWENGKEMKGKEGRKKERRKEKGEAK